MWGMITYCNEGIEIIPINTSFIFKVKNLINSLNLFVLISVELRKHLS